MTRDEAVAIIHQQLGFRSDLSSQIVTHMKLAQQQLELEPNKPWFLTSETLTTTTNLNDARVSIPSNMLEEYDNGALFYVPSDGDDAGKLIELKKDELDVLAKNFKDYTADPVVGAYPQAYALRGSYFVLFPTPDDYYTLKIVIYKQDTILTSNVENNWLKYAPLVLIGKTLKMIATAPRDQVAKTTGQEWEREGRLALLASEETRDLANQELQIGGPH
jgi:hypothetical protein